MFNPIEELIDFNSDVIDPLKLSKPFCVVYDNSFIGLVTNIINNINIGNNNIIGSSSLVIRDIKNNIFGYGVPFKERKKWNTGNY